jgi:NADH dehydrogenase
MPRDRFVVVGGGYAGLAAIRTLVAAGCSNVHLIDPSFAHQLITELPDALQPGGSVAKHLMPFDRLLRGLAVTRHEDRVTRIDAGTRQLWTTSGPPLQFDSLVVCTGSIPRYPAIPGLSAFALPFRTAEDVNRLRNRLAHHDGQRVVVLGGGLTGTEVAGALAASHRVTVIERAPRFLPDLPVGPAGYAEHTLRRLGVTIGASRTLLAVHDGWIECEGQEGVPYDVLVWAGGVAPSAMGWKGVSTDAEGFPVADSRGQIAAGIFIAGDLWKVVNKGRTFPHSADMATKTGRFAARAMLRWSSGQPLGSRFHPHQHGVLISLDDRRATGWIVSPRIAVRGAVARRLKTRLAWRYRHEILRAPVLPLLARRRSIQKLLKTP